MIKIRIRDSFTVLEPQKVPQLQYGEELNLAEGTYQAAFNRYTKGQTAPTEEKNITYELQYDEKMWDKKEGTSSNSLPILTRKSTKYTEVQLSAYENGDVVDRIFYYFDSLNFEVFLIGGTNQEICLYTNQTEETLTLNTENLKDKKEWSIEFEIGKNIPSDDPEEDHTFVPFEKKQVDMEKLLKYDKDKDEDNVTLYVQEVMKFLQENLNENESGELMTKVKVGDEVVYERGTPIQFLYGGYNWELPNEEECILPFHRYRINNRLDGRGYGANYDAEGNDIGTDIVNVKVDVMEGNKEDVHIDKDDMGWEIYAEDYCKLKVAIAYENPENTKETLQYTFILNVCGEAWEINEIVSNLGRNKMTMDETMVLQINANRNFSRKQDEEKSENFKLDYEWTLGKENEQVVELEPVNKDNSKCVVTTIKDPDRDSDYAYGHDNKIICTAYLLDAKGNRKKMKMERILFLGDDIIGFIYRTILIILI